MRQTVPRTSTWYCFSLKKLTGGVKHARLFMCKPVSIFKENAMILRFEGNQLFLDNEEVTEYGSTARPQTPAHYQKIRCIGSSAKGARIISVDEGGQMKIWDPARDKLSRRVWNGNEYKDVTALGVTEDGKRFAVAVGLTVAVYDTNRDGTAEKLEHATLPLRDKVTFLQFANDDTVICTDSNGSKLTLERDPAW